MTAPSGNAQGANRWPITGWTGTALTTVSAMPVWHHAMSGGFIVAEWP
jgi:hypothetical protein